MDKLKQIAQYYLDGLITGEEMYLSMMDVITDMADNHEADVNMRVLAQQILLTLEK